VLTVTATTKEEVIEKLKNDPYTKGEVWDWEKAQIFPVSNPLSWLRWVLAVLTGRLVPVRGEGTAEKVVGIYLSIYRYFVHSVMSCLIPGGEESSWFLTERNVFSVST
jgi:hypothetical protein